MMREWQKQIEEQFGIRLPKDDHSFGIQLKNKVWLGIWDGYDNGDGNYFPYWGFQYTGYRKDDMHELYEQTKQLLENVGIKLFREENTEWIVWCTTQHGVERFTSLYNGAKGMGLL